MRRLALTLALLSLPALAQTQQQTAPKSAVKKVTTVTFGTGEAIVGDVDSPDGVIIEAEYKPKFNSMIKVRESFADKLMESVNDL